MNAEPLDGRLALSNGTRALPKPAYSRHCEMSEGAAAWGGDDRGGVNEATRTLNSQRPSNALRWCARPTCAPVP